MHVLINRFFILMFIALTGFTSNAQVVFSESFDELPDSEVGVDEIGGVSWEADCPDCIDDGDYFKVVDGKLEGQDSNGPATWTSNPIDISECAFIEVSFDLSEEGNMEACGTGCNSVDYVMFEYNIDGAGWTSPADAYFCDGACAGVLVIQSDDIPGDAMTYNTGCMAGGDEIEVRITIQAWAASERWQIDNFTVSCSEGPEVDAGEDQVVCDGASVTLEADNPDGATLSWDHDVVDGIEFIPDEGMEDYVVSATDGVCTSTDTVLIEVIPPVVVVITPAGPFAEGSGIQTLEATPEDGTWSADCVDCVDEATGEFDPAEAGVGVWEICYTAGTEPCEITECILVEVTEDCELVYSIEQTNPTCAGSEDGVVSIEVMDATGFVSYTITNEMGDTVNTDNENFAADLPGGWYYFNVVDELSCFVNDSVLLVDPAPMMLDLTVETPVCSDDLGNAIIDTIFGFSGSYEEIHYEWSPSGDTGLGITSQDDLEEGMHSVVVTDENGCLVDTTFEISVPEPLILTSVELNHLNCFDLADGSIEIAATGGILPYEYALDGGPFESEPTFEGLASGVYEITLQDANGCLVDTSVTITSPPELTHSVEFTSETCAGLCDGTIIISGVGGTGLHEYSINDCLTSFESGTFTDLCSGDYEICLTDENGCTTNSMVTIDAGAPVLDGTILVPEIICNSDEPFEIEATNLGEITGSGVMDGVFYPAIAGVGDHLISNSFDETCTATYTATFTVLPGPDVVFTSDKNNGCAPLHVSFTSMGDIGATYYWHSGEGATFEGSEEMTYTYFNSGSFSPSLTVVSENGCASEIMYEDYIQVFEQPTANFSYLPNPITTLETTVDFSDHSIGANAWQWDFGGIGTSSDQHPSFTFPDQPGSFPVQLIATSAGGCADTTLKILTIGEGYSIYVPNTFTPDGDLRNNTFKPWLNGIDIYNYTLTIYNRWGEVLFISHDPSVGWDGTFGGNMVADGVYIYQIVASESISDKRMEHHGHVTLLR